MLKVRVLPLEPFLSATLFTGFQPHRKHVEQDQAGLAQPVPTHSDGIGGRRRRGFRHNFNRRLLRFLFTCPLRYMIYENALTIRRLNLKKVMATKLTNCHTTHAL
jgi:hypothetical protein